MLNEDYYLTAGNLTRFIAGMEKLLGQGSVTIISPGDFLMVSCSIRGLSPMYGGLVYEEVDYLGGSFPRQVQRAELVRDEHNPHTGLPRVHVRFLANTLTITKYDGTTNGSQKYRYIANHEPEQ